MKPRIRKTGGLWICGSYKETLQYFIEPSIDFDSLDKTKIQTFGQGSSPKVAYQEWVKNYNPTNGLLNTSQVNYRGLDYDNEPRTVTGYLLKLIARGFGAIFNHTDTDPQVIKSTGVK